VLRKLVKYLYGAIVRTLIKYFLYKNGLYHFLKFSLIDFFLLNLVLIISILLDIIAPIPNLEVLEHGDGIATSQGNPFLKKSSFSTSLVKKTSSLKYTNLSDKPSILCKFNSIG